MTNNFDQKTDYENLSNNRFLYFSIANGEIAEQEIFLQFLNNGNNYNLNIKHVPFFSEYSSPDTF